MIKIIYIKVNGKILISMVMVGLLKKTFLYMKDNFIIIKEMDQEQKYIKIQICIWVNLNKMRRMVQVFIYFKKVVIIMDFFKKDKGMVLVLYMIEIFLLYIMVFGKKIKNKEEVQRYILMVVSMMVILNKIKEMVLDVWNIQHHYYILVNGKMIREVVKVKLNQVKKI